MTKDKELKNKIDMSIKIVLIVIIILLLIHNCVLIKNKDKYQNAPVPNGNVDVIEFNCDKGKCVPKPTSSSKPSGKDDKNVEIKSISFAQNNISVKEGNTIKLIPVVKPGSQASSKFTWKSSDPSIASVDVNGNIKGLKEGIVTITVTSSNGKSAKCTVNVIKKAVNVEEIILNPTEMNLKVGDSDQISASVEPDNATERDIIWSTSDSSIATIDENGVVKAIKSGTVTITAKTKDGKVKATCVVNIEKVAVEKITLSSNELSLKPGSNSQLTATITPDNATDKELIWTSSDSSVATVDSNGKVTGIKPGEITITVKTKDGKVKSTCTVNVLKIAVESISLSPTEMSVKVGTSAQITAVVSPDNATDKELIWTSSDPSTATVDSNGKVTGVKKGAVTITAKTKDGKVKSTCAVTITTDTIDIENIILNPTSIEVVEGYTSQITATIVPDNATNRELIWTSSDPSIATVDSNGKVTGIKSGVITITAKAKNGDVVSTITVTVKEIPKEVVVYDDDKDPLTWNGSDDLKIFSKSIYNVDGFIAPESENTYKFVVKNNTIYKVRYSVTFIETNEFNINMKYKLKKNDNYLINTYSSPSALNISNYELNPGESDTYYLDWKWLSSSNDISVGTNPEASYGLKIDVEAESINE